MKNNMKVTDTHIYFWQGENWPSNFHMAHQFTHENITMECSEQAFMWEKARYFGDNLSMSKISHTKAIYKMKDRYGNQVTNTSFPIIVKGLGRKVRPFDSVKWDKDSYGIMVKVLKSKYSQEDYKKLLLGTGDKILVEASPRDNIWGVGLAPYDSLVLDEKNWTGQNLLGKALMEVRDWLKEQ